LSIKSVVVINNVEVCILFIDESVIIWDWSSFTFLVGVSRVLEWNWSCSEVVSKAVVKVITSLICEVDWSSEVEKWGILLYERYSDVLANFVSNEVLSTSVDNVSASIVEGSCVDSVVSRLEKLWSE
jgi:hypothetical protein